MNTTLSFQPLAEIEADALVVTVSEKEPRLDAALDKAAGGQLSGLLASGDFTGKAMETLLLYAVPGVKAKRVMLAGVSSGAGIHELRRLAGVAAKQLKAKGVHKLAFALPTGIAAEVAIRAVATGVFAANFEPDTYKSDRQTDRHIDELILALPGASSHNGLTDAVREAGILADGHLFARELANEPSNKLTPTMMAERAQSMAEGAGLECELIDTARARELKMGAFLSVAQGSAEPPVMIVLRYRGAGTGSQTLGLVGKGVTFDTGGISIKPAAGMEWMKFDMSGGAATLGAMKAIAGLKLKVNVLAVVPCTENMPGGRAQKPGDVQTAMNGKTIEVLNTDAEGRLILADALCYAREQGATHLVDSATLTGAMVIALGNVYTGVFANNDEFFGQLEAAAGRSGDKMWRMPLDAEYFDQIKGSVGDILNTGGRWGGAITAALFLQEFVGDTPWMHLDIAGTAYSEDNKAWMTKGPTGTPTFTLIEIARGMSGK